MKNLFTAALLVGLLAFSSNSFGDNPKEYMTVKYYDGTKNYTIYKAGTEPEDLKFSDKGLHHMMDLLNSLSEEGWKVLDFDQEGTWHTYLLQREK